jgi:hypothetical protein
MRAETAERWQFAKADGITYVTFETDNYHVDGLAILRAHWNASFTISCTICGYLQPKLNIALLNVK